MTRTAPARVRSEAKLGLELHKRWKRGGTSVGVARAVQLSSGKAVSDATIKRMYSYFQRHQHDRLDKDGSDGSIPGRGYIAWLLWGGNSGRKWAEGEYKKIQGKKKNPISKPVKKIKEDLAKKTIYLIKVSLDDYRSEPWAQEMVTKEEDFEVVDNYDDNGEPIFKTSEYVLAVVPKKYLQDFEFLRRMQMEGKLEKLSFSSAARAWLENDQPLDWFNEQAQDRGYITKDEYLFLVKVKVNNPLKIIARGIDERPASAYDREELKLGIKTELEHTPDAIIASKIAKDHLDEDPKYYSKLVEMERGMKKNNPLEDWSNEWVRYTSEDHLFINKKPWHQDPAGIYFFPKSFATEGSWHAINKYIITAKLKSGAKVLDLGKLDQDKKDEIYKKLGLEEKTNYFWSDLKSKYQGQQIKFANDLRKLGYDAVFDDSGTIHPSEKQLIVLNPKFIEVVSIEKTVKSSKLIEEIAKIIKQEFNEWSISKEKYSSGTEYGKKKIYLNFILSKGDMEISVSITHAEISRSQYSPDYCYAKLYSYSKNDQYEKSSSYEITIYNRETDLNKEHIEGLKKYHEKVNSLVEDHSIYTDKDKKHWGQQGAGGLFYCPSTKRYLIAHRSKYVNEPNTWGTWGGAIDSNESPEEALKREIKEETGYEGQYTLKHVYTYSDNDFKYHNYIIEVPEEFEPKHSWETQGHKWVELNEIPEPMHYGLKSLVLHLPKGNEMKKSNPITPASEEYLDVVQKALAGVSSKVDAWIDENSGDILVGSMAFEEDRSFDDVLVRIKTSGRILQGESVDDSIRKFTEKLMKKIHNELVNYVTHKKSNPVSKKNELKELIEKYNATGRIAFHQPKRKTVSFNGGRQISEEEAIKKLKEFFNEESKKSNPVPAGVDPKEFDSLVEKLKKRKDVDNPYALANWILKQKNPTAYEKLVKQLAAKGVDDPKALAAWIGRQKYGKEEFQRRAAAGRKKKKGG